MIKITICQEDVFGLGYYRYEVKSTVSDNLEYRNGSNAIFFNTKGYQGEINPEAKAILDFTCGIISDDPFIQELESEVKKIKNNERWRDLYMTQYLIEQDMKREGRKEERLEIAKNALDNGASIDFISKITGLSLKVISNLKVG